MKINKKDIEFLEQMASQKMKLDISGEDVNIIDSVNDSIWFEFNLSCHLGVSLRKVILKIIKNQIIRDKEEIVDRDYFKEIKRKYKILKKFS